MGSVVAVYRLSCSEACGILVSQLGIEPASPELQERFFTTGQPGKSPRFSFKISLLCQDSFLQFYIFSSRLFSIFVIFEDKQVTLLHYHKEINLLLLLSFFGLVSSSWVEFPPLGVDSTNPRQMEKLAALLSAAAHVVSTRTHLSRPCQHNAPAAVKRPGIPFLLLLP